MGLLSFVGIGSFAICPQFQVPTAPITGPSKADNILRHGHHLVGVGAFLNTDEMILEGDHLGPQELDTSWNLSMLPLRFILATKSEHVGGSTTKINFGG